MIVEWSKVVFSILFLATAALPAFRFGVFIEAKQLISIEVSETADEVDPEENDSPEPTWPVELAALIPVGQGSCETASRHCIGKTPIEGFGPLCGTVRTPGKLDTRPTLSHADRPSPTAVFEVVARPIHIHAPPITTEFSAL